MRLSKLWLALCLTLLMLSACVSSPQSEQKMNYRDSNVTPTLEIPPDLLSRNTQSNLALPGSKIGTAQNTGRYIETGNLKVEVSVLPVLKDFEIKNEGDFYWLEVAIPVDQLYPLIKSFWREQGFELIKDEPLIGVMETEWLSFKAGKKSFFASIIASLRASESSDQYRTRIERQGDKSRVFMTHRGQELIIDENSDELQPLNKKQGWQFVPSDRFKEVEMLSRLMIALGLQDERVRQQLENVSKFESRASIDVIKSDEDEQTLLMVKQGFKQTWNRLMYRMDQLGIMVTVNEKSNDTASIYLDFNGMQAGTDYKLDKVSTAEPQTVSLEAVSNTNVTRIEVLQPGFSNDNSPAARQLLNFLYEQLR